MNGCFDNQLPAVVFDAVKTMLCQAVTIHRSRRERGGVTGVGRGVRHGWWQTADNRYRPIIGRFADNRYRPIITSVSADYQCIPTRKTPLKKPNRGEGIVSTKPRPKSVYDFHGLLCCFIVELYDVFVLFPWPYVIYFIRLWVDIAYLWWKCR